MTVLGAQKNRLIEMKNHLIETKNHLIEMVVLSTHNIWMRNKKNSLLLHTVN